MFKSILTILCIFFSISADACDSGATRALPEFWKAFHKASLSNDVQAIIKYYYFPLTIRGPFDSDKPLHLNEKMFIEGYDTLFRKGFYGAGKTALLNDLESKPKKYWQMKLLMRFR